MKLHLTRLLLLLSFAALTGLLLAAGKPARAAAAHEKVDPYLAADFAAEESVPFLVVLQAEADLAPSARQPGGPARAASVVSALQATAAASQAPLIALLAAEGASYRRYWIANVIRVRGSAELANTLAQRVDVAAIYADPWIRADLPHPAAADAHVPGLVEWGVNRINAPLAWAAGITGAGIVIGGQDTGYDWDHPALINQYRGWDGASADHNYAWHDAIHENNPASGAGNPCGFDSVEPCDDYGHGTHTMGTMVGNDLDPADAAWPAGAANAVGVAPGAEWIGCRNMEEGWGMPSTYIECFQWFAAPTDLNDANPDPGRAPQVISNSWSCPANEGCDTNATELMETVVENLTAAGILVVVSAGNEGPACGTVARPPAMFDGVLAVGATSSSDAIASFSSRGPSTWTGQVKPDVAAPGVSVRSTTPGGGYGLSSGTSMAAPHVAGIGRAAARGPSGAERGSGRDHCAGPQLSHALDQHANLRQRGGQRHSQQHIRLRAHRRLAGHRARPCAAAAGDTGR